MFIRFPRSAKFVVVWALFLASSGQIRATGQSLPGFEFTRAQTVREWTPAHDISEQRATSEGMRIQISGTDPFTIGPARNYPADTPLYLLIRLKSESGGGGQIYYFPEGGHPSEANSVTFFVRQGAWSTVRVPLPALGPNYHLRFDPPGANGVCVLASLMVEPRLTLQEPTFSRPERADLGEGSLYMTSGSLTLTHSLTQPGGFSLTVAGKEMAAGLTNPRIGYMMGKVVHWLDLAASGTVKATSSNGGITVLTTARDSDGANWEVRQRFSPSIHSGAIDVNLWVVTSQNREVVFLPLLVVAPGAGTFGEAKSQALFAGLEYLDRPDSSSSQADIEGPLSQRRTPDLIRVTFPLMALAAEDRYIGLIWTENENTTPVFDSPDRLFHTGGHIMGMLFPGSNGSNRIEGNLLPYKGEILTAGKVLHTHQILIGGSGTNIIPAVKQYVALRGLPDLPNIGLSFQNYLALAARGYLDSNIQEKGLFRHAYLIGRTDPFHPAGDAPLFMEWLAHETSNAPLASRLRNTASEAIRQVPPAQLNFLAISHIHYPAPALVYGHVAESLEGARQGANGLLSRFEADNSILYRKAGNGLDFGRTHYAPDANGLTATHVIPLLETAIYTGDSRLKEQGLEKLRGMNKFTDTVPRGAQTWEVPLHTPDILAAAYLVKAYTMGYELTGDESLLHQAIYWAWTGVPFVYLVNPTGQAIGPYATTAVYGATQWQAPDWMGQPVQWCGLVYASALYRLSRYNTSGPWERIADGITLSGIQQTFPIDAVGVPGLLPDSITLRPQVRNFAAINPGTVLADAIYLYRKPEIYDYHVFRENGMIVNAPCHLASLKEESGHIYFTPQGWEGRPYYVLITGVPSQPLVHVDGKEITLDANNQYLPGSHALILHVEGAPAIDIVPK